MKLSVITKAKKAALFWFISAVGRRKWFDDFYAHTFLLSAYDIDSLNRKDVKEAHKDVDDECVKMLNNHIIYFDWVITTGRNFNHYNKLRIITNEELFLSFSNLYFNENLLLSSFTGRCG